MRSLTELGWNESLSESLAEFEEQRAGPYAPARISEERRGEYRVLTEAGELPAVLAGRLRHLVKERRLLPAVGDWVAARLGDGGRRARIDKVLPRKSALVRQAAGEVTEKQVVAANLDLVCLVTSLNWEFSPRRIERYLAAVWESGAEPILVLNKLDLCEEPESVIADAHSAAPGVDVFVVSALTGEGVDAFEARLGAGKTAALIGSSGVGKSTLINRLLGEDRQLVRAIREEDGRGRHTTTSRQLIPLPGGALLIDTPGMRELSLWDGQEGVNDVFPDIEQYAAECRYSDCRHESEPGCAVHEAVARGQLDADRVRGYRKLHREFAFQARRKNIRKWLDEKRRWRQITKAHRKWSKRKQREWESD